jgi:hypothetical protein
VALQVRDRAREVGGALIGEIVAVDGGEHDVGEPHLPDRFEDLLRLVLVDRVAAPRRLDGAEAAAPGAQLAEQHECRGTAAPTLGEIRAARLLADGREAQAVDQPTELLKPLAGGRSDLQPLREGRSCRQCGLQTSSSPSPEVGNDAVRSTEVVLIQRLMESTKGCSSISARRRLSR